MAMFLLFFKQSVPCDGYHPRPQVYPVRDLLCSVCDTVTVGARALGLTSVTKPLTYSDKGSQMVTEPYCVLLSVSPFSASQDPYFAFGV